MSTLKSFNQIFNGKSKAWIQLPFDSTSWIKKRFNQRGFSLVELMVVVAIIGILASIAIPNYQKFRRKAQQSGAKSALSGVFTAERTFTAEWSFGATDFNQIGYQQEGANLYNVGWETNATSGDWNATATGKTGKGAKHPSYKGPQPPSTPVTKTGGALGGAISLANAKFESCPSPTGLHTSCAGSESCDLSGSSCTFNNGGVSTCTGTCGSAVSSLIVPGNGTSRQSVDTFTIGAAANIGTSDDDLWTINQNKDLVNVQSGI